MYDAYGRFASDDDFHTQGIIIWNLKNNTVSIESKEYTKVTHTAHYRKSWPIDAAPTT